MRNKFYAVIFVVCLVFLSWIPGWANCAKRESLFKIERSKNRNVVQYDACLLQNNKISEKNPVETYWVLASGKKEELNAVENKQAYGIDQKEKLGENKFRILLAALKKRDIIVELVKGKYKALVRINGKLSILERVYVSSEEQTVGLPKVDYIDLFGQDLGTNRPVKERITPS